jgi:hypothetical protein
VIKTAIIRNPPSSRYKPRSGLLAGEGSFNPIIPITPGTAMKIVVVALVLAFVTFPPVFLPFGVDVPFGGVC